MIKINDFKNLGFVINWKLINIGFRGSDTFYNELAIEDVLDYAISLIEELNISQLVVELACEYSDNILEIENLVKLLAEQEDSNYELEFRKWRVTYVYKQLGPKLDNYIDGLVELGDIWSKFEFPEDSPHVIQGRNNSITPTDYYKSDNYEYLYNKNLAWIKEESEFIKNNQ
jgi:hypothetical protein